MPILISDEILETIRYSEKEFKIDLAAFLYQKERFTLAQAARFSGLSRLQMQKELKKKNIYLHYTPQDVEEDWRNIQAFKKAK